MKRTILATLLACALAPALAQETPPAQGEQVYAGPTAIRDGRMFMHLKNGFHMRGEPVKNAPYSATVINERVQTLADGNQIVSKKTSASYRDSKGRTREEARDNKGELQRVSIKDPVAHTSYELQTRNKTAIKLSTDPGLIRSAAEGVRARIAQQRKEGKLPGNGEGLVIKRPELGDAVRGQELRVRVPNELGDGMAARQISARLGPLIAGAMDDMKWAAKATTKDLGTREIEGLKAEGKLRSYEIPAGEIGNRAPIVVSDESWYSPDLQVTLYAKHSDPRHGETVYRLENVKRDEPAAALFVVPADYTVKDPMANIGSGAGQKGGQ
ncbi:hypothetical protein [Massilia horti]|uniref:Uncharacterized protein n=1 Tax=Massilia horti TaxID=2562153 RepID=A0A4Y9T1W8_9BURK|nr:hypothetical protein [Massilia horti]TFW31890.1 hypothetical protein E4O92_11935 [Massilia horti]